MSFNSCEFGSIEMSAFYFQCFLKWDYVHDNKRLLTGWFIVVVVRTISDYLHFFYNQEQIKYQIFFFVEYEINFNRLSLFSLKIRRLEKEGSETFISLNISKIVSFGSIFSILRFPILVFLVLVFSFFFITIITMTFWPLTIQLGKLVVSIARWSITPKSIGIGSVAHSRKAYVPAFTSIATITVVGSTQTGRRAASSKVVESPTLTIYATSPETTVASVTSTEPIGSNTPIAIKSTVSQLGRIHIVKRDSSILASRPKADEGTDPVSTSISDVLSIVTNCLVAGAKIVLTTTAISVAG